MSRITALSVLVALALVLIGVGILGDAGSVRGRLMFHIERMQNQVPTTVVGEHGQEIKTRGYIDPEASRGGLTIHTPPLTTCGDFDVIGWTDATPALHIDVFTWGSATCASLATPALHAWTLRVGMDALPKARPVRVILWREFDYGPRLSGTETIATGTVTL